MKGMGKGMAGVAFPMETSSALDPDATSTVAVGEVPRRRWFRRRVPTARVSLGNAARLGALLILGLVGSYYLDRQLIQRAPSRVVSDLPDFSYSLGRFTVAWDRSAAQLSVVHKRYWCISQCTRSVWETVPGMAFLTVADGSKFRFRETIAGHYLVNNRQSLRTTVQTLDNARFDPATRTLTLTGVLVKEHALPRAAWLHLRDMRASWQELTAIFCEHKADILLRTTYNMTFREELSPTNGRLAFDVNWDTTIYDGLSSPLSSSGLGQWMTPMGETQVVNVSSWGEDDEEMDAAASEEDWEAARSQEVTDDAADELESSGKASRYNRRQFDMVKLIYAAEPDERFYGLGAQFSSLDHSGKKVPILSQEQGIGRGRQPMTWALNRFLRGVGGRWYSTYTAVPHYISSLSRSLFISTHTYMEFDFTTPGHVAVDAVSPLGQLSGQIVTGRTPLEVVESYTEFSGRMRALPAWTQRGVILGMTGGEARVMQRLHKLQEAGCPVAAVWLQDWTGICNTSFAERIWWNWRLDEELYPDWDGFAARLQSMGIQLMTYVNPFLMKDKSVKGAMYREAAERGFLIQNARSSTPRPYHMSHEITFGLIDLSNPEAVEWIENIIRDMVLSAGVDDTGTPRIQGWMADFGEYLPFNGKLASGEDPVLAHNRYPEDWAALNRRVLRSVGLEGKGVFFSRSAAARSPTHSPLMWMGDQLVSWDAHDGIKSAIVGMLQAGLSGFALSHSDIGGYTAVPTRARSLPLLLRWIELCAFGDAVFRSHQGNKPFHNAQVWDSTEAVAHTAKFANVHMALSVYRNKLMAEAAATGAPLMRTLFLHYPNDPAVATLSHEFLLGRDMLVSPVLDLNVSKVHTYLPPGDVWRDLWTGERVQHQPSLLTGVWVTADAPLGWPAVFLREGACREANEAMKALQKVVTTFGGAPPPRQVVPMDATYKLILGYFDRDL